MSIAYAERHWRDGVIYQSVADAPGRLTVGTGFGLGDGVFETIAYSCADLKIRQNWIEHARAHLRRLRGAVAFFEIAGVSDDETLLAAMEELLAGAPFGKTYRVRLTVARLGNGSTTEIAYAPYEAPGTLPPLKLSAVIRPAGNPSARFKTLAYADTLAGQREVGPGATALFLNQWGRVACATYGNIYALIDGTWVTPAVGEGALPGIIRQQLLDDGWYEGAAVVEGRLTLEALRFGQVLYSNSLVGVRGIEMIE